MAEFSSIGALTSSTRQAYQADSAKEMTPDEKMRKQKEREQTDVTAVLSFNQNVPPQDGLANKLDMAA